MSAKSNYKSERELPKRHHRTIKQMMLVMRSRKMISLGEAHTKSYGHVVKRASDALTA